ncbi:CCHC-type domain-containing protein [Fusarium sp. LHS14.1]|nr:CCHC-type domain-containing protein [Fusarium sp. LHS14.1]
MKLQGDEADFAFVDYTAVSHSGFTTEAFHGTLATARARGFTILLLNRGLFTHEHATIDCRKEKPTSGYCARATCDNAEGHTAGTCPTRLCRNCSATGHSANECSLDLICTRCGKEGFLLQVYHRRYFLQTMQRRRSYSVDMPKPAPRGTPGFVGGLGGERGNPANLPSSTQRHGTVVTTPAAAATTAFRDYFKPDQVIIDEAATMREITTLIHIAFFDPKAWIITGDPYRTKGQSTDAARLCQSFKTSVQCLDEFRGENIKSHPNIILNHIIT